MSAAWLMLVFIVIFSITAPHVFPTATTFKLVLSGQTTVGMLALAVLIPISAGAFDLSIGTSLAFAAVIFSALMKAGMPFVVAVICGVAGCALVGCLNGFLVVRLHINSFIATLGVSELLSAGMLRVSSNQQITGVFPTWFQTVTQGTAFGINYDVYILLGVALTVWYVFEHTAVGRALFATGGNLEAARLAGVRTDAAIWGSLVASSIISGIAGILLISQNLLFTPDLGPSYLFPAFAAVFFGATQIKRRANVWGTLLALYALAVGVSGVQLTFFGNDYWITPLFNGVALLIAVALASREMSRRRAGRGARGILSRLNREDKVTADVLPVPEGAPGM
ncbi:MAG TPA: ABC transporter permease [Jatrophihabitantaceae bacterium]|nr:ABC transporter permease [Jatrophihabitantaceae bacterium]